jgi:hypothetical protein
MSLFLSVIMGAVIAGIIAYAIQFQALREARKQRDDDRNLAMVAQAHTLLVKAIRINANLNAIHDHFENSFREAEERGFTGEPWRFIRPLTNLPQPINFSDREMGMLLSLKDQNAFNSLCELDESHNNIIEIANLFSKDRIALTARLDPALNVNGIITGDTQGEEFRPLQLHMFELDSLVVQLGRSTAASLEQSRSALSQLSSVLGNKLDMTYHFKFD